MQFMGTLSKSMVSEECALNDALEGAGVKVVETDLGEYILQLAKEPPSHIIAPAFHLNMEDWEEAFRKHHTDLPADRQFNERRDILIEARTKLRSKFLAADVGITGANFLVAETGSSVIVTSLPTATSRVPSGFSEASKGSGGGRRGGDADDFHDRCFDARCCLAILFGVVTCPPYRHGSSRERLRRRSRSQRRSPQQCPRA